jgi:uncharacterized LabA/DUF88 family protein
LVKGKRAYATHKNLITKEDPRWRIRVDRLVQLITDKRELVSAKLYGSTPPPTPELWERFREICEVKTEPRSTWTNKEKLIDLDIGLDMLDTCCANEKAPLTIVLITGDGDFAAFVKKDRKGSMLEIWSWRHCISQRLIDAVHNSSNSAKIKYLDDLIDEIGFVEAIWNFKESDIPAHSSFVFKNYSSNVEAIRSFINKLNVPVSYNVIGHGDDLVVVFGCNMMDVDDNINKVMDEAAAIVSRDSIESFMLWKQRYYGNQSNIIVPCKNAFDVLNSSDDEEEALNTVVHEDHKSINNNTIVADNGDVEEDKFMVVRKSNPKGIAQTKMKISAQARTSKTLCFHGKYCKNYISKKCNFLHNNAQMAFLKLPHAQAKIPTKIFECNKQFCSPSTCTYHHEGEKWLCTYCDELFSIKHTHLNCNKFLEDNRTLLPLRNEAII